MFNNLSVLIFVSCKSFSDIKPEAINVLYDCIVTLLPPKVYENTVDVYSNLISILLFTLIVIVCSDDASLFRDP